MPDDDPGMNFFPPLPRPVESPIRKLEQEEQPTGIPSWARNGIWLCVAVLLIVAGLGAFMLARVAGGAVGTVFVLGGAAAAIGGVAFIFAWEESRNDVVEERAIMREAIRQSTYSHEALQGIVNYMRAIVALSAEQRRNEADLLAQQQYREAAIAAYQQYRDALIHMLQEQDRPLVLNAGNTRVSSGPIMEAEVADIIELLGEGDEYAQAIVQRWRQRTGVPSTCRPRERVSSGRPSSMPAPAQRSLQRPAPPATAQSGWQPYDQQVMREVDELAEQWRRERQEKAHRSRRAKGATSPRSHPIRYDLPEPPPPEGHWSEAEVHALAHVIMDNCNGSVRDKDLDAQQVGRHDRDAVRKCLSAAGLLDKPRNPAEPWRVRQGVSKDAVIAALRSYRNGDRAEEELDACSVRASCSVE